MIHPHQKAGSYGSRRRGRSRSGFTLVELVLAITITGILLAAMTSAIMISSRAVSAEVGPSSQLGTARHTMDQITSDLKLALSITEATATAVTFTVPDRTGDSAADTIRYAWSGTLGDPLTRTFNGTAVDVIPDVHALDLTYMLRTIKAQAQSGGGGVSVMAVSDMIDVKRNGRIYASAGGLVVSTNSTLINKIKVMQAGVIDGDAYIGPGGNLGTVIQLLGAGQITGTTGVLTTAVDIPNFTIPDLGVSTGDAIYSSGTTTISGDLHCNNFQILNNAIVQISGDVTINSDLTFLVTNTGQLQLLPGATLTIYSNFGIKVLLGGKVNVNTADPSRLTINNLIKHVDVKNDGILYATVLSPNDPLHVTNDAYFYGSFKGNQVKIDWNGQVCVQ